jgi:hypothetical protein
MEMLSQLSLPYYQFLHEVNDDRLQIQLFAPVEAVMIQKLLDIENHIALQPALHSIKIQSNSPVG